MSEPEFRAVGQHPNHLLQTGIGPMVAALKASPEQIPFLLADRTGENGPKRLGYAGLKVGGFFQRGFQLGPDLFVDFRIIGQPHRRIHGNRPEKASIHDRESFAGMFQKRRLRARCAKQTDIHQAFLTFGCIMS